MCFKNAPRRQSAWSLIELMVGLGVFSLSSLALGTIFIYCVRAFAAMANYATLDQYNRQAMDLVTRELRQAIEITGYASNATTRTLTFRDANNQTVTYGFDATKQWFTRNDGTTKVILTNCNLLNFELFTRPRETNSFNDFPVAMISNWQSTVKIVQMTWKTSISICPFARVSSEDIQTAKIVIRKQQD